jgi:acetyl esterase/lipase
VSLSWLFLAASVFGSAFTLSALFRGRRLNVLSVPYFFAAWLTSELALHHVVWQAAATIAFVAAGALTAWPGWLGLAITGASWIGLVLLHGRAGASADVFTRALREGLAHDPDAPKHAVNLPTQVPWQRIANPFRMRRMGVERIRDIAYGPAGHRHHLDVYRPRGWSAPCPTLLQIHGGGWTIGQKDQQGLPLMHHLAADGWVCVAANYRLSPKATFPDHLIDVKRALAWIRTEGARYGADPGFVVVTGGSAGGHLASLVALTANDPAFQPGFEEVDTSVAACVPFYGVYDFLDRHGARGSASMLPFLERVVMKCSPAEHRERWDHASPIANVHAGAPPFFVIHGTHDALAYVEEARHFVAALRAASRNPVVYAELPGAQHAFDTFHSRRSAHAVDAVTCFLEYVRALYAPPLHA